MLYAFYSYKGGVGRSMTVANLGEFFHMQGLRTLLIDWDLEAPGLETYFYQDKGLEVSRAHVGLIELLNDYKERFRRFTLRTPELPMGAADDPEYADALRAALKDRSDIPQFGITPAQSFATFDDVLRGQPLATSGGLDLPAEVASSPLGRYLQCIQPADSQNNGLFLLSAGRRPESGFGTYATTVQEFDWTEFYAVYRGQEYFDWFRDRLREIADVILIDTRTGVTEMGGVCTRHLPDAILSFCAPNFQNVDGVARILSGVNADEVKRARQDRYIQVMVIPSRIDDYESDRLARFKELFVSKLEQDEFLPEPLRGLQDPLWDLQIPYSPRYNYREELVIGPAVVSQDPVTAKLVAAYRRIAIHLAAIAPDDERVRRVFATEITNAFPHLSKEPRQMAPPVAEGWVDRPNESGMLSQLLLLRADSPQLSRVAVWGFGGSGKTALVAHVCRDPRVTSIYRDGILWLNGDRHWTAEATQAWLCDAFGLSRRLVGEGLQRALADRRFLLVADDVWDLENVEEPFKFGQLCTQVLITRDLAIAQEFLGTRSSDGLVTIGFLDEPQSSALLRAKELPTSLVGHTDQSELIDQMIRWPLGATLLRTAFDRRIAQGESADAAWNTLSDSLRRHHLTAFDQLTAGSTGDRSRSAGLSIKLSISRLTAGERKLLVDLAGNLLGVLDSDAPAVNRLKDLGIVKDRGERLDVHPLVRAYLISQGELEDAALSHLGSKPRGRASDARNPSNPDIVQAERILRGERATIDQIDQLADRLKNGRYFGHARRLYARARARPEFAALPDAQKLKLVQRHALCTYRDPDLPVSRFDQAIHTLSAADLSQTNVSNETLGLAGATYKYKWMLTGSRRDLEHSLQFYERGADRGVEADQGYTAINAAFVLDVLAKLQRRDAPDLADQQKSKAGSLRERIINELSVLFNQRQFAWLREQYWFYATLAEACFGLSRYDEARYWLREGLALDPPEWEVESTSRQLVRLAEAQGQDLSIGSETYRTLRLIMGDVPNALRAMTMGKIGLALSGGGFRASFFHIGVLARLAEIDVLRHVDVLSCVSGGSIIGAHYYLELRNLLQGKIDIAITREDFIDIVRHLESDFLAGVRCNIRTRLFAGWWANLRSVLDPLYTRTVYLGNLLERHLYSRVRDGAAPQRFLDELRIIPEGSSPEFNPKIDNWRRAAKAPILLLNATSLNTGHNWQFAVSWMGEPPSATASQIDQNDILRRMYYHEAPLRYRHVRLGQAVAASACVPGLFDPIQLDGLFPDPWSVRLVDGGVHDNQGIAGLLEQECTVLVVSDASGQMNIDMQSSTEVLSTVKRSNNVLMARVREAQLRELDSLNRSEAIRGLAFLHLKRDLDVRQIDWVDCQDPYVPNDQPTAAARSDVLTSYGIPKQVQRLLAGIRTDLDAFSETEAYALMLSGYRMAKAELSGCLPDWPQALGHEEQWRFLEIEPIVLRTAGHERLHSELLHQLSVGAQLGFKVWRLRPVAAAARVALMFALVLVLAFPAAALAKWLAPSTVRLWTTENALLAGLLFALLSASLWLVHRRSQSQKSFTVILSGLLVMSFGWLAARLHLAFFNSLYWASGRIVSEKRQFEFSASKTTIT